MSLDESRYHALADDLLERIADAVDEALGDRIDVEYQGGILTMKLPDGGQYVINKHGPLREIWMASPVSGASHYGYEGDAWVATREPKDRFDERIKAEIAGRFGVAVEF